MKRRFLSEAELLEKRDEIIEQYNSTTPKSKSVAVLTKRQRKVLGIGRDQGKAILYNARISARKVLGMMSPVPLMSFEQLARRPVANASDRM